MQLINERLKGLLKTWAALHVRGEHSNVHKDYSVYIYHNISSCNLPFIDDTLINCSVRVPSGPSPSMCYQRSAVHFQRTPAEHDLLRRRACRTICARCQKKCQGEHQFASPKSNKNNLPKPPKHQQFLSREGTRKSSYFFSRSIY